MTTPDDVLAAVQSKTQRDEAQVADLVRRGANLPAVRSFADGGMHLTFCRCNRTRSTTTASFAPRSRPGAGTIPAHSLPPGERPNASRAAAAPARTTTGSVSEPVVRTDTKTETASASGGGSFFGSMFSSSSSRLSSLRRRRDGMARMVGLGGSSSEEKPTPKAKPAATKTASKSKDDKKQANSSRERKYGTRSPSAEEPAAAEPSPAADRGLAAAGQSTINDGAQPAVPAGSFENCFGAWR